MATLREKVELYGGATASGMVSYALVRWLSQSQDVGIGGAIIGTLLGLRVFSTIIMYRRGHEW